MGLVLLRGFSFGPSFSWSISRISALSSQYKPLRAHRRPCGQEWQPCGQECPFLSGEVADHLIESSSDFSSVTFWSADTYIQAGCLKRPLWTCSGSFHAALHWGGGAGAWRTRRSKDGMSATGFEPATAPVTSQLLYRQHLHFLGPCSTYTFKSSPFGSHLLPPLLLALCKHSL